MDNLVNGSYPPGLPPAILDLLRDALAERERHRVESEKAEALAIQGSWDGFLRCVRATLQELIAFAQSEVAEGRLGSKPPENFNSCRYFQWEVYLRFTGLSTIETTFRRSPPTETGQAGWNHTGVYRVGSCHFEDFTEALLAAYDLSGQCPLP